MELNLKSFWNFLDRNKVYTFINLFGLTVSLVFVIVLGLYVQQETSRDSIHRRADRMYVMGSETLPDEGIAKEYYSGSHWVLMRLVQARFPDIEDACAIGSLEVKVSNRSGNDFMSRVLCADPNFYEFFDFPLSVGDKKTVLQDMNSIVVSRHMARTLFGNADPLGKTVTLNDTLNYVVTGIMGDMDGLSIIKPHDLIVNYEGAGKSLEPLLIDEQMSSTTISTVFLLEGQNSQLLSKEADMGEFAKDHYWWYQNKYADMMPMRLKLFPLHDLYFHENMESRTHMLQTGDRSIVRLLALAGLVILVFSVMNYVNLTVAQSGFRMREMAMRRLLGSQRWEIMARLMVESILLCLIALALAVLFAWAVLPDVGRLLDVNLQRGALLRPLNIGVALAFILLLGMASGLFPALVTSSAKPIEVVRGTFRRRTKMFFSKVFIVTQHVITVVLVAVALTMTLQIRHLLTAPLGYDTDNLIQLTIYHDTDKMATFAEEVRRLPGVKAASVGASGAPLSFSTIIVGKKAENAYSVAMIQADSAYLDVMGLKVMRETGAADAEGNRYYITRKMLEVENLPEDTPYFYRAYNQLPVSGILEDFHIGYITDNYDFPPYVQLAKTLRYPWALLIRVQGDPERTYEDICRVYREVYHMEPDFERPFIEDKIRAEYKDQQRYLDLVSLFAFVAIVISLLGLLAMSTYFIQQREKEIAVRKVFGSSSREVLAKLVRTFFVYVLVAFVIAVPIIRYFMGDWLSQFSYRIALSWWIYAVAGLFCLVVSLLTVFAQSWQAANRNPIETIGR